MPGSPDQPLALEAISMNMPAPVTENEVAMISLAHTKASLDAYRPLWANLSYEKASVVFVKDGRFTKAMRDGLVIASMEGSFTKQDLQGAIMGNVIDHARRVAGQVKKILAETLVIHDSYQLTMDIEEEIRWLGGFMPNTQFSAWVTPKHPDPNDPVQVRAEFRFWVAEARALIFADKGKAWAGEHERIIPQGQQYPSGDTHQDVAKLAAETFNAAVLAAGWE